VANGPGSKVEKSRTNRPSSGRIAFSLFAREGDIYRVDQLALEEPDPDLIRSERLAPHSSTLLARGGLIRLSPAIAAGWRSVGGAGIYRGMMQYCSRPTASCQSSLKQALVRALGS
jgi:hypothetical protein